MTKHWHLVLIKKNQDDSFLFAHRLPYTLACLMSVKCFHFFSVQHYKQENRELLKRPLDVLLNRWTQRDQRAAQLRQNLIDSEDDVRIN